MLERFSELSKRAKAGFAIEPEAMVDVTISEAGGDPRAAVLMLLKINQYLLHETRRLTAAVSPGFMRSSLGRGS